VITLNISSRIYSYELLMCALSQIPKVLGSGLNLEHLLIGNFRTFASGVEHSQKWHW
jgi:hypothetical protein